MCVSVCVCGCVSGGVRGGAEWRTINQCTQCSSRISGCKVQANNKTILVLPSTVDYIITSMSQGSLRHRTLRG